MCLAVLCRFSVVFPWELFSYLPNETLDKLEKLLPRHPQLDHHPLLPFVIDHEMAMQEKAAVFLKVRARDGLASAASRTTRW
jgi:hypothetical protein